MENTNHGFFIEKRFFNLQTNGLANSFSVKSSPYDYAVNFTEEENPFAQINQWFENQPRNILFIDKNVYAAYQKYLKVPQSQIFQAQANENFKTLEGAADLIDFLQANNFTKAEKLIVFGGGVIQDVAALVGALYKRGITWVFFPTTLLAMCDSCIGAKASINYRHTKNQLGLFCAPKGIYINVNFLKTLDAKQIKSGLGEIFKLCVTGGEQAYRMFTQKTQAGEIKNLHDFQELIKLVLSVKKSVIEVDEFDKSFRKGLNYGHTFGHALETLTDYAVPHGQAVVAGMAIANELSAQKNLLSQNVNQELYIQEQKLLGAESKAAIKQIDLSKLMALLKQDKKAMGNNLNLVLLKKLGHLVFYPMEMNDDFFAQINVIIKKLFN